MILFCKAIEFAVEVVLREICVKFCKKSGKWPKMVRKNAEQGKKSGKSQEKMKAN